MPNLSLCMIVKNEEKYLRDCLLSVKNIVDEIIITDTGSSDKTINIAEEFGAKIFHFDWINDFAAARNYSLSQCKGDWVLYLDADERLNRNSIPELKKIIKSKNLEAFTVKVNSIDEVNNRPHVMRYQRLFRNHKDLKFTGKVHEQLQTSFKELKFITKDSNIEIIHIGYNISKEELKRKAHRNLELLIQEYEKNKNYYEAFQLAQTYNVLDDKASAVKFFKLTLEENDAPSNFKAHACRYIAAFEKENNRLDEALIFALKGLKYDPHQPILNIVTAKIYQLMNKPDETFKHVKIALESNKKLRSGKLNTLFDIYVDDRQIIYFGLDAALFNNDLVQIKYFLSEYSKLKPITKEDRAFILVFEKILKNEELTEDEVNMFPSVINEFNSELVSNLINKIDDASSRMKIITIYPEKFRRGKEYFEAFGKALMETERTDEAIIIFEQMIAKEMFTPSVIFYMISLYLTKSEFTKIKTLLNFAEKRYENSDEVIKRLSIIKQKLSAFL